MEREPLTWEKIRGLSRKHGVSQWTAQRALAMTSNNASAASRVLAHLSPGMDGMPALAVLILVTGRPYELQGLWTKKEHLS